VDPALARLADGKYVLVTTFRKNGTPVPTPVWAGRDGDALVFFSAPDAGKVKRLRRDNSVELTECSFNGTPTGETVKATADLLDAAGADRARKAIARKYGLIGRLTMLGSRLRRGRNGSVCYAVTTPTPHP
jgi:PPOX class probable F420-dependent enzyme